MTCESEKKTVDTCENYFLSIISRQRKYLNTTSLLFFFGRLLAYSNTEYMFGGSNKNDYYNCAVLSGIWCIQESNSNTYQTPRESLLVWKWRQQFQMIPTHLFSVNQNMDFSNHIVRTSTFHCKYIMVSSNQTIPRLVQQSIGVGYMKREQNKQFVMKNLLMKN